MRRAALLAAFLVVPAVVHAQQPAAAAPADPASGALAAVREQWSGVTANVAAAAQEFSEADYAYRPVATVRTVGEMIGHVAGSQFSMCAAALGEPARAEDAIEKAAKTKAALLAALKESTEYCARAYAQTGTATLTSTQLFGSSATRMQALALNAVHNGEHYGNLVTYMRMKGMVPPSSKR